MTIDKLIHSLTLGSAVAATLGTASVALAVENPFAAQSLEKGYMVADSHRYHDDKGGYVPSAGYDDKKDGHEKRCGEGRCGMLMADTDNDGRVSRNEHARHAEKMFDRMDYNRDGYIDRDEANAMKKKYRHGQSQNQSYGDRYSGDRGESMHSYGSGSGEKVYRDLPHMRPMGEIDPMQSQSEDDTRERK